VQLREVTRLKAEIENADAVKAKLASLSREVEASKSREDELLRRLEDSKLEMEHVCEDADRKAKRLERALEAADARLVDAGLEHQETLDKLDVCSEERADVRYNLSLLP
jgi:hypothetical protein